MTRLAAVPNLGWQEHAACRDANPSVFSPVDDRGRVDLDQARHVAHTWCAGCPVITQCRTSALVLGAQEIVQAGAWWPLSTSRNPEPVNLLDNLDGMDAA
ncbi:WhiB family transcriptional regulator [Pseudonocardia hispaniensis]|uniref:WhiB family transcriptional regulator n=1 Tax=Pseudonocardia hispaniensis TaxID=904933 RepID=A0ABW1J930_9PSEU